VSDHRYKSPPAFGELTLDLQNGFGPSTQSKVGWVDKLAPIALEPGSKAPQTITFDSLRKSQAGAQSTNYDIINPKAGNEHTSKSLTARNTSRKNGHINGISSFYEQTHTGARFSAEYQQYLGGQHLNKIPAAGKASAARTETT